MDAHTFRDPRVGEALKSHISVRYEAGNENADAVIERFQVGGFPTLLVLDPDGSEVDEIWGNSPEDLVKDIERVQANKETLKVARESLRADPDNLDAILALARKLCNRYADAAVALCLRAHKLMPADATQARADLLDLHAYAESSRGRSLVALALYERILDEHPKAEGLGETVCTAMNCMYDVDPERGLAFIGRALPLVDPKFHESIEHTRAFLYERAAAAHLLKRGEQASKNKESDMLNFVAWTCFERGRHTKPAIGWAREAVALSNRDVNHLDTLANLLFVDDQIGEAIKIQTEAVESATDAHKRAEFEEGLAKFKAVQALRARRASEKAAQPR